MLFLALFFTGCSALPKSPLAPEKADPLSASNVGIDGAPCVGGVIDSTPGLVEAKNPQLLERARMPTDKGGVCAAKVFSISSPIRLYRVFSSGNPHSKFGSWWTLRQPDGTREDYRAENAICNEWSKLDRVVSCEVRPGSQIVIGTTQSAACSDGSIYPKSATNQVFVPNDGRAGIIHVGACSESAVWP